jgi:hypothetical protein
MYGRVLIVSSRPATLNPHMYVLTGLIALDGDEALGFHIAVVLARIDGPEQCPGEQRNEHEAQGYQQEYDCHASTCEAFGAGDQASRAAFVTTARELIDMPSAAIQGEMSPAAASGTDTRL